MDVRMRSHVRHVGALSCRISDGSEPITWDAIDTSSADVAYRVYWISTVVSPTVGYPVGGSSALSV
jgi:hypothetical protein